jgi:hypothetical protein
MIWSTPASGVIPESSATGLGDLHNQHLQSFKNALRFALGGVSVKKG